MLGDIAAPNYDPHPSITPLMLAVVTWLYVRKSPDERS
jgi:hypothetical protein